jgi:hypothetical protein
LSFAGQGGRCFAQFLSFTVCFHFPSETSLRVAVSLSLSVEAGCLCFAKFLSLAVESRLCFAIRFYLADESRLCFAVCFPLSVDSILRFTIRLPLPRNSRFRFRFRFSLLSFQNLPPHPLRLLPRYALTLLLSSRIRLPQLVLHRLPQLLLAQLLCRVSLPIFALTLPLRLCAQLLAVRHAVACPQLFLVFHALLVLLLSPLLVCFPPAVSLLLPELVACS